MEQGGGRQWADAWDGAGQEPWVEMERDGACSHGVNTQEWVKKSSSSRTHLPLTDVWTRPRMSPSLSASQRSPPMLWSM